MRRSLRSGVRRAPPAVAGMRSAHVCALDERCMSAATEDKREATDGQGRCIEARRTRAAVLERHVVSVPARHERACVWLWLGGA